MWTNSKAQFKLFLGDFENFRPLGGAATHVYPQADKVDSLPQGCNYSFIGRSESMVASMKALFPTRSLPAHNHKAEDDECKVNMMKTFSYGPEETRKMCHLLYADFVCFGYPFPDVCK